MKIVRYAIMVLVLCSVVFANPTAEVTDIDNSFVTQAFEEKYITGGTLSKTEVVKRGETLDASLNVKFTRDAVKDSQGNAYKLILFFIDDSGNTFSIRTFVYKTEHKKDDWILVNARTISTSVLPDSFCNKGLKIGGMHVVYTGSGWVEDSLPSITWESGGVGRYKSSDNFLLTCDTVPECQRKLLRTECDGDRVVDVYQSQYLTESNQCGVEQDTVKTCSSNEACVNGDCVVESSCSDGSRVCDLGGKVSKLCVTGQYQSLEGLHVCTDTTCDFVTGDCSLGSEQGGLQCVSDNNCNADETCNTQTSLCAKKVSTTVSNEKLSCSKDYYCADGKTVFMFCKNGFYESNAAVTSCPTAKTCTTSQDCSVEGSSANYVCVQGKCAALNPDVVSCNGVQKVVNGECKTDFTKIYEQYKVFIIVGAVLVALIIILLLALLFKPKRNSLFGG